MTEETHLTLLASKTRVAPLVKQTIPRLELLLALILARLIASVKTVLEGLTLFRPGGRDFEARLNFEVM